MSESIWSAEEWRGFTHASSPEVRYWAADRLIRHHPDDCCDAIADLLLDEHEFTPPAVARHLGRHGGPQHHAILVRGFRLLRGLTPGLCLQALARLGYPGVVNLAASALKRGDLTEPALGVIVEALSEIETPEARSLVREFLSRKVEVLTEPAGMRGVLRVVDAAEIPDVLRRFLTALERRGSHRAGEVLGTLMDALQIDDTAWCFRTGPGGHIELRKTIKAVESGYDCDISGAMGSVTINHIAQRFRAGSLADVVRSLAGYTAEAVTRFPHEAGSDLPQRIAAAVGAFTRQDLLDETERLGPQMQQSLLGFQLSAAFAVARQQNFRLALNQARGDLARLLELAVFETSFLVDDLPAAIALVCHEDEARGREAEEWCLRMLESQGPFFPKVIALQTLGELRAVHFIPEMIDYLSDENTYVYGAAEKALGRLGERIIGPAIARVEDESLHPDGAHSILVLLCDMGTQAAHAAVAQHLNWFMNTVGPGSAADWIALFGTDELIEPLRDWLDQDPALVGQALLLLGAIHNVDIPEEDEIITAIEHARAQDANEAGEDDGPIGSPDRGGGNYVM